MPGSGNRWEGPRLGQCPLAQGLQKPASWQEVRGWVRMTLRWDAVSFWGCQVIASIQVREMSLGRGLFQKQWTEALGLGNSEAAKDTHGRCGPSA